MTISERAKRLIEALHEIHGNEARWMVAQAFLDEERPAWQNVKGAPIPDWVQGRGQGVPGGRLIVLTAADKDGVGEVVTVEPSDWIIGLADGSVVVTRAVDGRIYSAAAPLADPSQVGAIVGRPGDGGGGG